MIRMVTKEPEFNDIPTRCFTLPFVATECFCSDIPHLNQVIFEDKECRVMNEFFSFVSVPEEQQLNSTLCGYFNKIISYWLIKHPNEVIDYLAQN